MEKKYLTVDGIKVEIAGEPNVLEVVRKAGVDLPTFCYQPELGIYGSCRMCIVEIDGRGVVPACSTAPVSGMVVKTNTKQLRESRKMIVELLLSAHDQNCTTCPKSGECKLQSVAKQYGITKVRFAQMKKATGFDETSDAIVRDPSKCILCGNCVRTCGQTQSIGALNIAYRGSDSKVIAGFNKGLGTTECVNCGQCIKVCPVGALSIKSQIEGVWDAIHDESKTVVVQIAPAVRVALGEQFGAKPGTLVIGKIISALRHMGFDKIYDTCFAADFTVVEEGKEFLKRYTQGGSLPLFTSCCPAWVKLMEQDYPELMKNVSSCRSPQQMFGSLAKDILPKNLGVGRENIVVVSIMPCTAKKFEARRPEFSVKGNPDVDFVITTKELAQMIKQSGIEFGKLPDGGFDSAMGTFSGGAVIFGSSGGVSEAVLRFAAGQLEKGKRQEFTQFRGNDGVTTSEVRIGDITLRLAVVSGLANARKLIEKIKSGREKYDLVEVMACCSGCINGGGQPEHRDGEEIKARRKGIYDNDQKLPVYESSENPELQKIYADELDEQKAHKLLHTSYKKRGR